MTDRDLLEMFRDGQDATGRLGSAGRVVFDHPSLRGAVASAAVLLMDARGGSLTNAELLDGLRVRKATLSNVMRELLAQDLVTRSVMWPWVTWTLNPGGRRAAELLRKELSR